MLKIWPCTTSALSHCAVYTILYKCISVFVSIRQDELVLTLGTVLGWCWHRVLRNSYTLHLSRTSLEYYHLHDNTPPNCNSHTSSLKRMGLSMLKISGYCIRAHCFRWPVQSISVVFWTIILSIQLYSSPRSHTPYNLSILHFRCMIYHLNKKSRRTLRRNLLRIVN